MFTSVLGDVGCYHHEIGDTLGMRLLMRRCYAFHRHRAKPPASHLHFILVGIHAAVAQRIVADLDFDGRAGVIGPVDPWIHGSGSIGNSDQFPILGMFTVYGFL